MEGVWVTVPRSRFARRGAWWHKDEGCLLGSGEPKESSGEGAGFFKCFSVGGSVLARESLGTCQLEFDHESMMG